MSIIESISNIRLSSENTKWPVPQIRACFREWEQATAALLVSRQGKRVAERLAFEIMAQLQGAALLSKVWQGERVAEQAFTQCAALLKEEK